MSLSLKEYWNFSRQLGNGFRAQTERNIDQQCRLDIQPYFDLSTLCLAPRSYRARAETCCRVYLGTDGEKNSRSI
jgi:hypothetical protein